MGQYSPDIEELLKSEDTYEDLKRKYDSIGLIKLVEKLCYSYHAHQYTPLGAWEGLDKMCRLVQTKETAEVTHCERFRSMVEVCKASSINFALLCTANVDMAMEALHEKGKISMKGSFKDGTYFNSPMTNERQSTRLQRKHA